MVPQPASLRLNTDSRASQCVAIAATVETLHASNGDPLMLIGKDAQGWLFIWPTVLIQRHPFAFARWCKRNIHRYRGAKFYLQHELDERTQRWARWLGVDLQGVV